MPAPSPRPSHAVLPHPSLSGGRVLALTCAFVLILLLLSDAAGAQSRATRSRRTVKTKNSREKVVFAEILKHVVIDQGVAYTLTEYPRLRWSVHTLTVDLSCPGTALRLGKGLEHVAGLERVQSILARHDSVESPDSTLGGMNANYWQAGSNYPIGPTVIDGVVVNGEKHRNWSALAISEDGGISIDNYSLRAEVRTHHGVLPIDRFNSRRDSASRVLYTSYYGDMVPPMDTAAIFRASEDTVTDDSEAEATLVTYFDSLRASSPEGGALKVQFEYLHPPTVNGAATCIVTHLDTGFVSIPPRGGVLSLGYTPLPFFYSLFVGDTFSIAIMVDPPLRGPVQYMAAGTPRLVRDGRVSVEWQEEGLRKIRFVTGNYARSAFGVSRDGRTAIFVTVEGNHRRYGRRGISLESLGRLLVDRGAWQAMNFDGGSSATLVVKGETVSPPAGTRFSRKISTALFATRRKPSGTVGRQP
jgi:hypothetical protein